MWTPDEKVMRKMDDDYEVHYFCAKSKVQNMLAAIQAQQAIPKERAAKELLAATVNKEKVRMIEFILMRRRGRIK